VDSEPPLENAEMTQLPSDSSKLGMDVPSSSGEDKQELDVTGWPSDEERYQEPEAPFKDSLSFTMTGALSSVSCSSPVKKYAAEDEPATQETSRARRGESNGSTVRELQRARVAAQEERQKLKERLRGEGEDDEPLCMTFETKMFTKSAIKDESPRPATSSSGSFAPKARTTPGSKQPSKGEKDSNEQSSKTPKSAGVRKQTSEPSPKELEKARLESLEEKRRMKEKFMARHAECTGDTDGVLVKTPTSTTRGSTSGNVDSFGDLSSSPPRIPQLPGDSPSTVCPSTTGGRESTLTPEAGFASATRPEEQASDANNIRRKDKGDNCLLLEDTILPEVLTDKMAAKSTDVPTEMFALAQDASSEPPLVQYYRYKERLSSGELHVKAHAQAEAEGTMKLEEEDPDHASSCSDGSIEIGAMPSSSSSSTPGTAPRKAWAGEAAGGEADDTIKLAEAAILKPSVCRLPSGALDGTRGARSVTSALEVPTPSSVTMLARGTDSPRLRSPPSSRSNCSSALISPNRKFNNTLDLEDDDGCSLAAMTAPNGNASAAAEAWKRADEVEARRQELLREQRQRTRDYLKKRPSYSDSALTPTSAAATLCQQQTSPTKSDADDAGVSTEQAEESEIESW